MARYQAGMSVATALSLSPSCVIHASYSTSALSGANVSTLTDLSVNRNNFTQSTPANQPTVSSVGGYRSIRFTKANQNYMVAGALSKFITALHTFVCVVNTVSATADTGHVFSNDGIWGDNTAYAGTGVIPGNLQAYAFDVTGEKKVNVAAPIGSTVSFIQRTDGTNLYGLDNLTAQVSTASTGPSGLNDVVYLGKINILSYLTHYDGHILFAAWFKRALNTTELDVMLQAMGAEFGLNTSTYL